MLPVYQNDLDSMHAAQQLAARFRAGGAVDEDALAALRALPPRQQWGVVAAVVRALPLSSGLCAACLLPPFVLS
jgi:hypothetical protein